jgi:hypothetical protein
MDRIFAKAPVGLGGRRHTIALEAKPMATLTVRHRGETSTHVIDISGWEPVPIRDESGEVEIGATGGNVLLRFGSPGPDFSDEVTVHEGESREVALSGSVYARAFVDRPVGDF